MFLSSPYANYLDLAMLAMIGLAVSFIAVFFSMTFKRFFKYILKWAFAWTLMQVLLYFLNSFPAYALLRTVAWSTFKKMIGVTGLEDHAMTAWEFAKEETKRLASDYLSRKVKQEL